VSGQRHALPRFTPRQRTPSAHCTGGRVCLRAGLDKEDRGKILSPLPGIEPVIIIIIIIISGSTVLVRTLAASHRTFRNLFLHLVGLLWTSNPVEKGLYLHRPSQHIITRANINSPSGIRTRDPSNEVAKTYAFDLAATGIGKPSTMLKTK
jgi:hypothetical protein